MMAKFSATAASAPPSERTGYCSGGGRKGKGQSGGGGGGGAEKISSLASEFVVLLRVQTLVEGSLTLAADPRSEKEDESTKIVQSLRDRIQDTSRRLLRVSERCASRVPYAVAAVALRTQLCVSLYNKSISADDALTGAENGACSLNASATWLLQALVGSEPRRIWDARASAARLLALAIQGSALQHDMGVPAGTDTGTGGNTGEAIDGESAGKGGGTVEGAGVGGGGGRGGGRAMIGPGEILLFARGEVLRAVCVRAQGEGEEAAGRGEGGGTIVAVASNKNIRETTCRPGHASIALSVSQGMHMSAPAPNDTSSGGGGTLGKGGWGGGVGGGMLPVPRQVEKKLGSAVNAVEGILENIWDSLSTGADEVLRLGTEHHVTNHVTSHVTMSSVSATLSAYSALGGGSPIGGGGGGGGGVVQTGAIRGARILKSTLYSAFI
jgi:hypothetical protein